MFLCALRNLPHVHVVFHEAMQTGVFGAWEKSLGVPLSGTCGYYDHGKVRHYSLRDISAADRAITAEAMTIYEDFQREVLASFPWYKLSRTPDISTRIISPR